MVDQSTRCRRNIAKNFNRLSRCTSVTYDRQTDRQTDSQTDDRRTTTDGRLHYVVISRDGRKLVTRVRFRFRFRFIRIVARRLKITKFTANKKH